MCDQAENLAAARLVSYGKPVIAKRSCTECNLVYAMSVMRNGNTEGKLYKAQEKIKKLKEEIRDSLMRIDRHYSRIQYPLCTGAQEQAGYCSPGK